MLLVGLAPQERRDLVALAGRRSRSVESCDASGDVNDWRGNLFAAYGKAVGVGWDGRSG